MLLSELKKKTTCLYNLFKEIVKQRLECSLRRIRFLFHQYCVSNETLKKTTLGLSENGMW